MFLSIQYEIKLFSTHIFLKEANLVVKRFSVSKAARV